MRKVGIQSEEVLRPHLYISLTILMVMCATGAFRLSWQSSLEIHINLGLIAAVLALAMGLGALVRFYARRNAKFLFIGAGFLGTAALDALHTAIGTVHLLPYVPATLPEILPVSWNTSQFFLGAMLLMGSGVGGRGDAINPLRLNLRLGIAAFILICCFAFALGPLAPRITTSPFADRVLGVWTGIVLLCARWTLIRKRDWIDDRLEYWLVAALLLACGSQLVFLTQPEPLFGAMLDTAHLLKIGAYSLALTGVLSNGYQLLRARPAPDMTTLPQQQPADSARRPPGCGVSVGRPAPPRRSRQAHPAEAPEPDGVVGSARQRGEP